MRKLDDIPDDAPAGRRKASPGVLALLERVSDGLEKIEGLRDELAAMGKRLKALESEPRVIQNNVTVPKDSTRVEVTQAAPPAAVVHAHVPPAQVTVMPADPRPPRKLSIEFFHESGKIRRAVAEEV